MARKILCEICKLIGPYFMHIVIKEIRMHLRMSLRIVFEFVIVSFVKYVQFFVITISFVLTNISTINNIKYGQ